MQRIYILKIANDPNPLEFLLTDHIITLACYIKTVFQQNIASAVGIAVQHDAAIISAIFNIHINRSHEKTKLALLKIRLEKLINIAASSC